VVVANQVIEHLLFPAQFMREVYRLVRPGGYAVLSTENLASWDNVAALVLGFTPFSMEFDGGFWKIGNPLSPHAGRMWTTYAPHARIFTLAGLRDLARLAGFRVEAAMGTGHVLGPPMQCVDPRHCRFISIRCRRDPASRGEPVPHA
jgi:SAM-dependent methyltransferase